MRRLTLLFVIYLSSSACVNESPPAEGPGEAANPEAVTLTEAQARQAMIETDTGTRRTMAQTLRLSGVIDVPPQNMVSVSNPLGGYLLATKLLPGAHINKGEVIATMEDQQYIQLQQDYLATQSKLAFAQQEYERQKQLNGSKAGSDKQLQQAEMDYHIQKIALSALAEKLRLIHINPKTLHDNNLSKSVPVFAPISGYVSKVNVNIGRYIAPTEVLFELVNPTDIHLNLHVFEKDVASLFIGQKLEAFTNNQPEKKHRCEIILISKDLAPDRTLEVHCHFEDYDKTLLPGMYMNAEIALHQRPAFAVPEASVVRYEGLHYVFVQESKNRYRPVAVTPGVSAHGYISVAEGDVLSGKSIVTKGAYTLLMALKNTPEEE